MRSYLLASSIIELTAGLALVLAPSTVSVLLLGAPLEASAALVVGRVAGAALASLGIACWHARGAHAPGARPAVVAMLAYNFSAAALLLGAGLGAHVGGAALWPAVVLHAGMGAWSVFTLR